MNDFLQMLTAGLLCIFACTGFALWARWGIVGLSHLWHFRHEVDEAVRRDAREVLAYRERRE